MEGGFFAGQLLIAMPGISDPRFERAVILVCAHDNEHAMGVAVNRPVDGLTVPDVLEKLKIKATITVPRDLVLMGGPVERERGFVVHTDDYRSEHSLEVGGGVALSATREVLEAIVAGHPNKVIGHRLQISPRTVEIHRARVMEKTGARSLSHLVRMALEAGILPEGG